MKEAAKDTLSFEDRNMFKELEMVCEICEVDIQQISRDVELTRQAAMELNVADVRKPLASAVCVIRSGNMVVMDMNDATGEVGGYIENRATGERMQIREANGTFVYDVKLENGEVCTITLDSGAGCNVWPRSRNVVALK